MGFCVSKLLGTESQDSGSPGGMIGFSKTYQHPRPIDDDYDFPLDGKDIASVSDKELLFAFATAPRLYEYGYVTVSRVSKDLVIKSGPGVAETTKFALETLQLPVPRVHRAFIVDVPDTGKVFGTPSEDIHLIVMDYIKGSTVEKAWRSFDIAAKENVAQQVADVVNKMQSTVLNHMRIGPIGRAHDETCQGPWFAGYGTGPFDTLKELEDWCNHKVDVGIMVKQLLPETPRFEFKDTVLTHQDLAMRNLVVNEDMKVWVINWGCAGVYPKSSNKPRCSFRRRIMSMLIWCWRGSLIDTI
ncbi:kinase-like (PK-like) [Fusarium denticulatum]|uniref:Kinase-like (PK-like) n=1 Tax=Fusarium denticulatum TaxID=48507 RepID=A0A8H5U8A2_9HYPO|nr:kinase-like (PK-like) [Fusarium denticulatum]